MAKDRRIYDYFDKYTFICEMYHEEADEILKLILEYFPFDDSIQVINTKKKKFLVRRVQNPNVRLEMLKVGNIVNVFSKLLHIIDCVPATKKKIFKNLQSTFVLIKPVPAIMHGKVITFITQNGFSILRIKNGRVDKDFAMLVYANLTGNSELPIILDYLTSGEIVGLEISGPDAVNQWVKCLGATNPEHAAPGTLRKLYGENILKNIAHGSKTVEESKLLIDTFFGYKNGIPRIPFQATLKNCTCCIVKPHALIDGNMGSILEKISASGKFQITAMASFIVKQHNANEFYEVYKKVVPEYEAMAIHLTEGTCIALEVKCWDPKLDCVQEFRKLCGPRDPDMCRQLYPDSIRALYGKDIVHNAVHCTDLAEDGTVEVEYFFKFLAYDN